MALPDPPVSDRFLTQDDRIAIADALRADTSVSRIAEQLGKHRSTVYREIARGTQQDGVYQPWWSHNQVLERRKRPKEEKLLVRRDLREIVQARLDEKWSPQQIARHLARSHPDDPALRVSTETIYRALFAGRLGRMQGRLRTGRTRRRRQRRGVPHKNRIPNMLMVHDRPAEADDRVTPGHWEGDLIIGRGQHSAVGTLVDRATRFVRLIHLPTGWKAPQVRDALAEQLGDLPHVLRRTLTWDQGRELYYHDQVSAMTGLKIFFCDPHAPWQRGSNENANGLLRQYLPKGSDLSVHSLRDLHAIARQLNDRPRIVLGDRTPADLMRPWL
ncbi:IS30 family transposase [Streptomyces sp. NPDC001978]|uniref:IS30 family transposase n=1 Tax=Streptomyces sp. NPDC001978 TaxID=3364627 RepID=UPI00369141BC